MIGSADAGDVVVQKSSLANSFKSRPLDDRRAEIRQARAAGPEVRQTEGGLPYRVSRTNTPDLEELRLRLTGERSNVMHQPPAAAHAALRRSPHPPPAAAPLQPCAQASSAPAWIKHGLGTNISGNKTLAPSNRPGSARPRSSRHWSDSADTRRGQRPGQRPQTARVQRAGQDCRDQATLGSGRLQSTQAAVNIQKQIRPAYQHGGQRALANATATQNEQELHAQVSAGPTSADVGRDIASLTTTCTPQQAINASHALPAAEKEAKGFEEKILREPAATVEGRWANGIQKRLDGFAARDNTQTKHEYHPIGIAGSGKTDEAIVAAASRGAILPFSSHPITTAPSHAVWKRKTVVLDTNKTSAGLTQDLLNWSKFDPQYHVESQHLGSAFGSSKVPSEVLDGRRDQAQTEEGDRAVSKRGKLGDDRNQVQRRDEEEITTAMMQVQQALEAERASDSARFHAMVRKGWTMAERPYEDALHLDLRRGLSNAKKRLDSVILERDQFKASSEIFEGRWKSMRARAEELEDVLELKQAEMMELKRETDKLRFLIGMREGEIAQKDRFVDYLNAAKESDRMQDDMANVPEAVPGGAARPSTPVMNEIHGGARSIIKDLDEIDEDLAGRVEVTEKMREMVEVVINDTQKRVLYEASLRPTFVEIGVQTACEQADMEAICALDEAADANEDPWHLMQKIRAEQKRKVRTQVGVPESFKDVVADSRRWQQDKEERLRSVVRSTSEIQCTLLSFLFSKMEANHHDSCYIGHWPRTLAGGTMPHHVHEVFLQSCGFSIDADLKCMDFVAMLEHQDMRSNVLLRIFARLCGMSLGLSEKALPAETLNYLLDVLYVLHEMIQEQQKRAKMSAKERSEKKALTDAEIFAKSFTPIADDDNALILELRAGEHVSFKKAQVCKVIEHCMAKCGRYKYSEAEKLNFQEANKLLDIEDTLEFAVQVYEDVRSNRQALLKDIMRQTCPSGKLSYQQLEDIVLDLDPLRPKLEVRHIYREMTVRSGSRDRIDLDVFCQVLQEQELDRPADYSLVLKGADPFRYLRLPSSPVPSTKFETKGAKKIKREEKAVPVVSDVKVQGMIITPTPLPDNVDKKDTRAHTRISFKDKRV